MMRAAAAAGIGAWTAPFIVESLTSPAAAATGPCACYRVQFDPQDNDNGDCASMQTSSVGGVSPCGTLTSPSCLTPITNLGSGNSLASLGLSITVGSSCVNDNNITFTLNPTGSFPTTSCPSPRRIVAAQAVYNGDNTTCVQASPLTTTTASFAKLGSQDNDTEWVAFQLLIACGC